MKSLITFWQELKARWRTESPTFWKKIQKFAIILGTSSASVIGAEQLFNLKSYGIHPLLFTVAGYIIVACATLGLAAKITKKDNDDNNDKLLI